MSATRFEPLALTSDFRSCLSFFEYTDESYFVTGKAGTGKSTLLQLFKDTTRKRVAVVAPTGIAALNVRGQTIHSFFGFPPYPLRNSQIHVVKNQRMYQRLQTLVIDEISMVRADMLDQIDYFLRVNCEKNEPFGGIQLICFGDLYQLPPVLSNLAEKQTLLAQYETPYFYSAHVFRTDFDVKMIELNHVYRQEEMHFIQLLDRVRTRTFDYDDLDELNQRAKSKLPAIDKQITLSSTNAIADRINAANLQSIDKPIQTYHAEIEGEFNQTSYPTEITLVLKEGAQVMFVRNDPNREFVNGSIGTVVSLGEEFISVEIDQYGKGKIIELQPMEWHIIKYKLDRDGELQTEVVGTFRQFPLRLAWAITIHKSQGKTFDKISIDLGYGAFEFGQTYVALSRCRTLEGIILNRPLKPNDILVDERINEFYDSKKKVKLTGWKPWLEKR